MTENNTNEKKKLAEIRKHAIKEVERLKKEGKEIKSNAVEVVCSEEDIFHTKSRKRNRASKELVGKLTIYKKIIHLDRRFLYKLVDLHSFEDGYHDEYNLERLIHTIAHEVAHCLLGDYSLDLFQFHGEFHDGLIALLEKHL
ncbi:29597_t:CDS:2 [Gigaspora margarita]|uniref:29597_t:CDS:1 n=1 Tax=Gigaspora margarita TaxID=4874 RepID=A0ABN7WMJ7_GIGMA|nr:29597_t:CDS:2 [Gigaspora margarita]